MRLLLAAALAVLLAGPCMTAPASSSPDPPDAPSDSFLTPSGFDLQGHRGARGLAPENTIPAFRRALELGVTTLESG
jgi:glycerophosphoryl diester phosphodiesterase